MKTNTTERIANVIAALSCGGPLWTDLIMAKEMTNLRGSVYSNYNFFIQPYISPQFPDSM